MKKTPSEKGFDIFNVTLLIVLTVATMYPFYYTIVASVSDSHRLISFSGVLLKPLGFSLDAYRLVLKNPNITTGYINTAIIVILGTSLNLVMTTLGAYALSRKQFRLRGPIMLMIAFTMFFDGGLIPNYLLINNTLHLGGSLAALIVPVAISAWNLIIMRTSFEALPESLMESARIDGAGEFRILFSVVVPLSMPVISVMMLYYGVQHWNSWFNAVLYIRDRSLYPLQLILREILIQNGTGSMTQGYATTDMEAISETIKYATVMVATLPILFVYPFLQKYFAKGVMIGALKE